MHVDRAVDDNRGYDNRGYDAKSQPKTLLLVEDNEDASAILAELFQSEGYHVHMAYDGVEAIQKATQFRPDVIVMDIGLPGMDGYETARRMRRSPAIAGSKLVALTGWGSSTDRELALAPAIDLPVLAVPIGHRHSVGPQRRNELHGCRSD